MEYKKTLRIAMAVTNDVVTDRRVQRHAAAMQEAGCVVRVIGRTAWKMRHGRGWRFYAEYNRRLLVELLRERADIVWANDTDTLAGCWLAAKLTGARLVMDAHELFPEVPEIEKKPVVKWVWRTVERLLMPGCDVRFTVCQSIADYYRQRLGLEMGVVRNVSSSAPEEMKRRRDEEVKSGSVPTSGLRLLLYQGCVNVGRGVDWAIDALEWLEDCRLVVAGDGDLLEEMKRYAAGKAWSDRVTFLGRLMPEALARLTPEADVGLVMLEDRGLSYHYALPNRIGDFVQAGVPMVVSDLPEMARVVRRYKVGEIMREPTARALAECVRRILAREWSERDFEEARRDMDWEREKRRLVELIERVAGSW